MRWTFDPLMAGNAAFNLGKLGAIVRRYVPDFYGRLGSVLQGGTPTDRLLAEWNLASGRVHAARTGILAAPMDAEKRIELPEEISAWKQAGTMEPLEAAQRTLRQTFQKAFAEGFLVSGFVRNPGGGGTYLLDRATTKLEANPPESLSEPRPSAKETRTA
jgi:predicted GNAT superfamily acetyltransferase